MSVKDDFYITALERVNLSNSIINLFPTRYRYLHSTTQNFVQKHAFLFSVNVGYVYLTVIIFI